MLSLLEEAWALVVSIVTASVATLPFDDTGRFVLLLVAALGAVVVWSALGAPLEGHFAVLTLLLAAGALALVLVGHLLLFYLLWEIVAIVCWAVGRLVNRRSDSVLGALPIQGIGGVASLAMFSGVLWLTVEGRAGDFSPVNPEHLPQIAGLILFALLTKSLSAVTQSWHDAPARVGSLASALLATVGVVCLGVYPLWRFVRGPFAEADWLTEPLLVGGLVLAAVAAVAALGERDMYKVVSYSALVHLGLFAANLARLGPAGASAAGAAAPALWGVAAYCAAVLALYLALGNVERVSGERTLAPAGGVGGGGWARALPLTAVGAFLAALVLAMAPPAATFGLAADLGRALADRQPSGLVWLLGGALALQFLALLRLLGLVFGGRPGLPAAGGSARFAESQWHVLLAVLALGAGGLVVGFDPAPLAGLLRPVIGGLAG